MHNKRKCCSLYRNRNLIKFYIVIEYYVRGLNHHCSLLEVILFIAQAKFIYLSAVAEKIFTSNNFKQMYKRNSTVGTPLKVFDRDKREVACNAECNVFTHLFVRY